MRCLGIARGDAKKKLTKQLGLSHEEIAKCKCFNNNFVEKRNLGSNLLVQPMGMNAMYQNVISAPVRLKICLMLGKRLNQNLGQVWFSEKPAMQSQRATEFANCFQMPDEPIEKFLNKINEICARMVTGPGDDMNKRLKWSKELLMIFIHLQHKKPERFRRGAIFVQAW
jgi:hypothetical protein